MGLFFKIPAWIIYVVGGLWGFVISMRIVTDNFGFIGGLIAFFLAPVTLIIAPWYEGFAHSNWFPVALCDGGFIVATVLMLIGAKIDGD